MSSSIDPITPLSITDIEKGVGYVYRWVNLLNGAMYIGSHCGNNPNYTASGSGIKRAFSELGMENFSREYLYVGPDYREEEEKFLILVSAATNPLYYNYIEKSFAPPKNLRKFGVKNSFYGRKHTEESIAKMSMSAKARMRGSGNPMYGRIHTEESRRKMSESSDVSGNKNPMYGYKWSVEQKENQRQKILGNKHTDESKQKISDATKGENNPFYGKIHTEESRKKISQSRKGKPSPLKERVMSDKQKENQMRIYNSFPSVKCPYCPKTGLKFHLARWHFDNCKERRDNA